MNNQVNDGEEEEFKPLDAQQLVRIAAVHRGFLYQHLYAVACLLTVGRSPGVQVVVERDEDVEISLPGRRRYCQIKTRSRALQPADIADALIRFEEIREEHRTGRRDGTAEFEVVSNAPLGPVLAKSVAAKDWPSDVTVLVPGVDAGQFPPAWVDVDAALGWCVERAGDVPFGALAPSTLVWKLAALVQHAATGARNRTFAADDLPQLLEQLLVQLQDFPDPPANYRPQINEPPLLTQAPIRLLVGFSGAGKTAWASQAAMHSPTPVAYFDVGELPETAVATGLARELAARFLGGRRAGADGALLAEGIGIDVLRASGRRIAEDGTAVTVVLDNVHRMSAAVVRSVLEALPGHHLLALAQPWDGAALIEATHQITAERLEGWARDDVAAEFAAQGCPATVAEAERIRRLTGGLPLYVRNAAFLIGSAYGGDVTAFASAVEARVNDVSTAQELILEDAFTELDDSSKRVAAVLQLSEVALTRDEVAALSAVAEPDAVKAAKATRSLRRRSILIGFQGDRVGIHDALRPLASEHLGEVGEQIPAAAKNLLLGLLMTSLQTHRDVSRLSAVLRLLPQVGQVEALVDLAGEEMFHEQGDPTTLRSELQRAADDDTSSYRDRFWANDALAYWESRDGGVPDADRLIAMEALVAAGDLGSRERLALAFKQLVAAASARDAKRVAAVFQEGLANAGDDTAVIRMLKFNLGVCLYRMGDFPEVLAITSDLIAEYYSAVGIAEDDVFLKSNQAVLDRLPKPLDYDDVKRLADSLALWSKAVVEVGSAPLFRRIHAAKFYAIAQAARSTIDVGQEAADDFLLLMADPTGAMEIMQQMVLPPLAEGQLIDLMVPVRSHYAIVLAWCGRLDEARRELSTLAQYAGDPDQERMLDERTSFVEQIARGEVHLQRRSLRFPPGSFGEPLPPLPAPPPSFARPQIPKAKQKIGRNEPCPCGSGAKFKKCHGG